MPLFVRNVRNGISIWRLFYPVPWTALNVSSALHAVLYPFAITQQETAV